MKRPGNGYLFDEDDIGNSDSIKEGIEVLLSKELLIQSAGVVQFHRKPPSHTDEMRFANVGD